MMDVEQEKPAPTARAGRPNLSTDSVFSPGICLADGSVQEASSFSYTEDELKLGPNPASQSVYSFDSTFMDALLATNVPKGLSCQVLNRLPSIAGVLRWNRDALCDFSKSILDFQGLPLDGLLFKRLKTHVHVQGLLKSGKVSLYTLHYPTDISLEKPFMALNDNFNRVLNTLVYLASEGANHDQRRHWQSRDGAEMVDVHVGVRTGLVIRKVANGNQHLGIRPEWHVFHTGEVDCRKEKVRWSPMARSRE